MLCGSKTSDVLEVGSCDIFSCNSIINIAGGTIASVIYNLGYV